MKQSRLSEQATKQIKIKLSQFNTKAEKPLSIDQPDLKKWFIENVMQIDIARVPRISLLKQANHSLRQYLKQPKRLNQLFLEEESIVQLIIEARHFIDIAFILQKHLQMKVMQKKIDYAELIIESFDAKIKALLEKQQGRVNSLLRVNYVFSFIDFKQSNPKEIYDNISKYQLQELREEIYILFTYLFKVWFQKKLPKDQYHRLTPIVYWMFILDDNNPQKEQALIGISKKIFKNMCLSGDNSFVFINIFNNIMDAVAINYRKEDPFKPYGFAPLLNLLQAKVYSDLINNWLASRGKHVKPVQIQNIFRNTFHIGSVIFSFNLINQFSTLLVQKKQYNILYHIFVSYIKKDYLQINLPNMTFLKKYLEILETYVIGFINRDRLDGQSELDKLTNNFQTLLLRKNYNFDQNYRKIILFYKMYENRFSYLSSASKRFLIDLEKYYHYTPPIIEIHQKIHKLSFRQAGMEDYQQNIALSSLINQKKTDRYRGMLNLGNTCYMNSFMQALFMTKKFTTTILDIRDQAQLSSSKVLTYALINLFTEMTTKKFDRQNQIIPDVFKQLTPQPFQSSWDQHDVGQFGRMYLQSLTNELQGQKAKQRIQKLFFNKIFKRITCTKCKYQKQNQQLVLDFILHPNKADTFISVTKLLQQYFRGEQMKGDNQVYCSRCKKNTEALSIPEPKKLAEYLVITINLFQYSHGGIKIQKPFQFQFTINFTSSVPTLNMADQIFQLYAFIVHVGNKLQRGHYICYARNLQQNPVLWYCFNDNYVTQKQIQKVQDFRFGETQTPYLLFYSKQKSSAKVQNNSTHYIKKNSIKIN